MSHLMLAFLKMAAVEGILNRPRQLRPSGLNTL